MAQQNAEDKIIKHTPPNVDDIKLAKHTQQLSLFCMIMFVCSVIGAISSLHFFY